MAAVVGLLSALGMAQGAAALEVGTSAPEFELATQDGKTVRLSNLKGKIVYLDFWASWCGPCRASFPWMNDMQAKYGAQGLQVVGVNLDATPEDARKFLAQVPASFQIAYDPKGATPRAYGVKGMPTSLLIDRDGKVIFQHMGFNHGKRDELEQKIRQALGEKK